MIAGHLFDRLHLEFDKAIRDGAPGDMILDPFETVVEFSLTPDGPAFVVGIASPSPIVGERLLASLIVQFDINIDWSKEVVPALFRSYRNLQEQAFERLRELS